MRRLIFLCTFFCVLGAPALLGGPGAKFSIVFSVYPENCSLAFLDSARAWGATGVSIWANWWQCEPSEGSMGFDSLDASIARAIGDSLDVYVRVALGQRPDWLIGADTQGNAHITAAGTPLLFDYSGGQRLYKPQPNFASGRTIGGMVRFYDGLLAHLQKRYPPGSLLRYRIREMVPTVNHDGEMEYPYEEMCGYSDPELLKFREYLLRTYGSLSEINARWGSAFRQPDQINPREYHWENQANDDDLYPAGRPDWLAFRTLVLKQFIDTCAMVTHKRGFLMLLQIGSFVDNLMENRGWVDPTPLVENVDCVVSDEIFQLKPSFALAALYSRSLCRYWDDAKSDRRGRRFATETNWPGYLVDRLGRTHADLVDDWLEQLRAFYLRGGSLLSVAGWDHSFTPATALDYARWRDSLLAYHTRRVLSVPRPAGAVRLSSGKLSFSHNSYRQDSRGWYRTYAIDSALTTGKPGMGSPGSKDESDIVTDYMQSKTPAYIKRYARRPG